MYVVGHVRVDGGCPPIHRRDGDGWGSVRLALGTTVALPTAMAFLGLSVAVVLARSLTALGARVLAREIDENPP